MSNTGSIIIITRTSQFANRLRAIKIFINGKNAGYIDNGKTIEFPVPAGPVELYAKIDWCKTRPVTLKLEPGHKAKFELGSRPTGFRGFLALYYLIFQNQDWIYLRQTN
jgi:hypothetical protein